MTAAAVFDCMVFLQAATSRQGPAFACLEVVERHEVTLHVTPTILAEVRDVLRRPKIQAKFPHLTRERVDLFIQKVSSLAAISDDVPSCGFPLRDVDDLPYLDLSVASRADYPVSRDLDLLDLMKDPAFTSGFPFVRIVDPSAFLAIVRTSRP